MSTWADFMDGVRSAYWTEGEPTNDQKYRALADYAHATLVRQLESDLALAKSFRDSYADQKVAYAGSRVTDTDNNVVTAVSALLPVDASTEGIDSLRRNAILQARDSFNGTADSFEQNALNAAMDLQRHVPFYQGRHETTYTPTSSGINNQGFVSEVSLPTDFRVQNVWAGRLHTPLVGGTYASGDVLSSNGRFYKVVLGGTITDGEIGDGLTSQDRKTIEPLGSLTFQYVADLKLVPARNWPWADREAMFSGRLDVGPVWSMDPQSSTLWLYPALVVDTDPNDIVPREHFFTLEWSGVKTSFADGDSVTFDLLAQQAAAEYIRGIMSKNVLNDGRATNAALALYQTLVKKAVIDNQARAVGTVVQVSSLLAMNLGCCTWWNRCMNGWSHHQSLTNNFGQIGPGNSEALQTSTLAGTVLITPLSMNHVENVTFNGAAGTYNLVLQEVGVAPNQGLTRGARLVVFATFPLTPNLILQWYSGTTSNPVIVEAGYTTDGFTSRGVWEFDLQDDGHWHYLRAQVPA